MLKAILIFTSIIGTVPAIAAADEAKESSGYIGSETCGACHADQYNAWKTSKHAVGNNSTDGPEKAAEPTQDWGSVAKPATVPDRTMYRTWGIPAK
jgi:hypothetical protein